MTPEQLKQKPFEEIFKNQHERVDTDEGESTKAQEEFTTSEESTEEYSTFSHMSKQDSESDINVDDTQDEQNPHTPETLQIHNMYNTMKHKNQNLWKHLKFLLYSTKHYIMKMIHQMTNL